MHIHNPDDPEATNEAMSRGEPVFFVPHVGDADSAHEPTGTWPDGWTECGYTDEGETL